jgi:hypothetical protein
LQPIAIPEGHAASDGIAALSPSADSTTEGFGEAPSIIRAPSELIKGLGSLAKAIKKTSTPGVYELHPQIKDRVAQLLKRGQSLPQQADWSGGENVELLKAVGGDDALARRWARLFGATSPGTSVPVNTRESLSTFAYALEKPGQEMTLETARSLDPVITMAGSKVPSINRAYTDQPLTKPKPEELAKLMVGKEPGTPLDVHALYGMGSKAETFQTEIPALRTKMTKAEGLPQRGGLTDEQIYYRTADALTRALDEVAPDMAHNPRFATFWEGGRDSKGLKYQGGPLDILRKKGLLEEAAMLDLKQLHKVLKSSGWTAGAIAATLRAVEQEQREPSSKAPGSGSSRAAGAAEMNARVSRPEPD